MPDAVTTRVPWLRLVVVIGLLTFSGVTLASNVIPARDDVHATRRMLEEQERENEQTRQRIVELREDADALGEDAWVVDRAIRELFHRTDEGEIRVR